MADFETIVLRPRIPKAQSSWNDKASLNPPPHTSPIQTFSTVLGTDHNGSRSFKLMQRLRSSQ